MDSTEHTTAQRRLSMTTLEILKYAYAGCLERWGREYDRLQKHPENNITKAWYDKFTQDLDEIKALILKEELNEIQNQAD